MRRHLSQRNQIIVISPNKAIAQLGKIGLIGSETPDPGVILTQTPMSTSRLRKFLYELFGWLFWVLLFVNTNLSAQSDSLTIKGISDYIELANKLMPSTSGKSDDPIRIQRSLRIRVNTNRKKLRQVKRLNKEYKKGMPDYQYDALLSEILAIDVNDVRQLRILSTINKG